MYCYFVCLSVHTYDLIVVVSIFRRKRPLENHRHMDYKLCSHSLEIGTLVIAGPNKKLICLLGWTNVWRVRWPKFLTSSITPSPEMLV
jgi:hypothetical protein